MHILIVRNNSNPRAIELSLLLATYFASQGIEFSLADSADLTKAETKEKVRAQLEVGIDLAVVLGGDGTILRTASLMGSSGVPILGINFGHLGFLANSNEEGVLAMVAEALADAVVRENRANLQIDVVLEGESDPFGDGDASGCAGDVDAPDWTGGDTQDCAGEAEAGGFGCACDGSRAGRSFFALNEMAITRGTMGRIIDFTLDISDARIAEMRGDGLVVASATGSTAYALSAGGPLVAPSYMGLVVVPLAPHTIRSRAVLTGENDVVCIDLSDDFASREATLFVDGELVPFDAPIRRIYVRRGPVPTVLLRYSNQNFYEHAAETFF